MASRLVALLGAAIIASSPTTAATSTSITSPPEYPVTLDVDFSSFLERCNPTWSWNSTDNMPSTWTKSLFVGNADLGAYVWSDGDLNSLRVDISRTVVYDDRQPNNSYYLNNFVYDQPRLPIGHFILGWNTPLNSATGEIDLYTGLVTVNLTTQIGTLTLKLWASADWQTADVLVLETIATAEEQWSISFIPDIAQSTWSGQDPRYVPNPPPVNASSSQGPGTPVLNTTTQGHLGGTAHTTAILQQGNTDDLVYYITISPVLADAETANTWATQQVQAASTAGDSLWTAHTAWWNSFWPNGGFLTVEYSMLESFWYTQLYKFASASRTGRAIHDLMGPWFIDGTPWPDLHTDMNLEQTYYFPIAANRPELAGGLVDYIAWLQTIGTLNTNVPLEWQSDSAGAPTGAGSLYLKETCYWNYGPNCTTSPPSVTGNLLWILQVTQLVGEYAANNTIDINVVFPLLDRALQAYQHFQVNGSADDGLIHLPNTFSPEYPGPTGPDANYDLSLYRWGLTTAINLAAKYGLTSPHLQNWKDTLAALTWYSIDNTSNTFEIYAGIPYGTPHRHYSHLFMIWPLRALNFTNMTQHETAKLSVDRWLATPEEDSQFYRPAASAMNVMLGQRAAAFDNISYLLHTRIEANTFYTEGSQGSCTETPYAGAYAVVDWLIGSWNTTLVLDSTQPPVRVLEFYPGIDDVIVLNDTPYVAHPSKVSSASFYRLGASGGALVSGARAVVESNSTHYITRTAFVAVEVPAGNVDAFPLIIRTNMERPLVSYSSSITFTELGEGMVHIENLQAGQGVVLYSSAFPVPSFSISPAAGCPADYNYWGLPMGGKGNSSSGGGGGGNFPPAASQFVNLQTCQYGADGKVIPSQQYIFATNASSPYTGQFQLQDGSNRCVTPAVCTGLGTGVRLVLAACAPSNPPPPTPGNNTTPIGCDASSSLCDAYALQTWTWSTPSGTPPNAISTTIGGASQEQYCFDVNGALTPDIIDIWTCDNPPGEYKNLEWAWNATTGALLTLDTAPGVVGKCLTPA